MQTKRLSVYCEGILFKKIIDNDYYRNLPLIRNLQRSFQMSMRYEVCAVC